MKSEIRSYSEAVKSANVPKAASVSVKEVQKVVQNVVEADDRSKNIIVFGLKETDDEDINVIIDEVLENVGCKPRHESVRIGFKKQTEADSNKHRPVKVSVASAAHAIAILRSAKRLKSVERFKNVFRLKIPLYILDQESGMEHAVNMTEKARISTTCIIKFPSIGSK